MMVNQNLRHRPVFATFDTQSDDLILEIVAFVRSAIDKGSSAAKAQREPLVQPKPHRNAYYYWSDGNKVTENCKVQ
jgi:hypothetical protein